MRPIQRGSVTETGIHFTSLHRGIPRARIVYAGARRNVKPSLPTGMSSACPNQSSRATDVLSGLMARMLGRGRRKEG